MDIEILRRINENHSASAQLLIKSAKNEIDTASRFPLNYLPQLLEATKIDLKISEKMLEASNEEKNAINELEKGNKGEANKQFEQVSKKRLAISQEKYNASMNLTNLAALNTINETISKLGKSKRTKKSSKTRRTKKNKCK
jgi:hypothetical protein